LEATTHFDGGAVCRKKTKATHGAITLSGVAYPANLDLGAPLKKTCDVVLETTILRRDLVFKTRADLQIELYPLQSPLLRGIAVAFFSWS